MAAFNFQTQQFMKGRQVEELSTSYLPPPFQIHRRRRYASRGTAPLRTIVQAGIPGPVYLSSSPSDRTRLNAGGNYPSSFVPFPLR